MQIGRTLDRVDGNGKSVSIEDNVNTHTGEKSYFGAVYYVNESGLDFDQRLPTLDAARRWFATWRKLTETTDF